MFSFTAGGDRRSLQLARLVRASGFALLCMAAVSTVHAQQNGQSGNGNGNGQGQNQGNGPQWSATPELDSLFLFGAGMLGFGGYALTRIRSRRRP